MDHFGLLGDEVFEGLCQIRDVTVASRGRGIGRRRREREAREEIASASCVEVEEFAAAYDFACYVECGQAQGFALPSKAEVQFNLNSFAEGAG